MVTGASDGIGAEYCRQLAVMGFNICLVSRTLSKLEIVEKQVNTLNPKIKTKVVQADFANTNMEYFENIKNQVKDLDIAVLVVNAGAMTTGRLSKHPETGL